jgi:hypothetical protein
MSVLDEMAALEAKIAARIRELAPLAAEHERLRQYADKLGIDPLPMTPSLVHLGAGRGQLRRASAPRRASRPARPSARQAGRSKRRAMVPRVAPTSSPSSLGASRE